MPQYGPHNFPTTCAYGEPPHRPRALQFRTPAPVPTFASVMPCPNAAAVALGRWFPSSTTTTSTTASTTMRDAGGRAAVPPLPRADYRYGRAPPRAPRCRQAPPSATHRAGSRTVGGHAADMTYSNRRRFRCASRPYGPPGCAPVVRLPQAGRFLTAPPSYTLAGRRHRACPPHLAAGGSLYWLQADCSQLYCTLPPPGPHFLNAGTRVPPQRLHR